MTAIGWLDLHGWMDVLWVLGPDLSDVEWAVMIGCSPLDVRVARRALARLEES